MKKNYRLTNANSSAGGDVAGSGVGNGVLVGPDGSGFAVPDCGAIASSQDMTNAVPTPIISEADAQAFAALSGVPVSEVNRKVGTNKTR